MSQDQRQALWDAAGHTGQAPVGYGGESGGGSGGSLGAFQGPSVQPFTFDWTAAQNAAMAKLAPYYKQLLDLSNGDINRAKQALEADYASGARFRSGEYGGQMTQENLSEADEKNSTLNDLNSRGVLFQETAPGQQAPTSNAGGQEGVTPTTTDLTGKTTNINTSGVGGTPANFNQNGGENYSSFATGQYFDPLLDKQQQRRNAIQRAIQRQSDTADTTYGKDIGDTNSQQTQKALSLGEQQSQQAQGIAANDYNSAYAKYQGAVVNGSLNPYLDTSNNSSNTGGA